MNKKLSTNLKKSIIVGIIDALCGILIAFFSLIIIGNTTIMVKGASSSVPPSFLGITPVIIQSSSMSGDAPGHLEKGDMALVKSFNFYNIKEGDVILYVEDNVAVCHRVVGIDDSSSARTLVTKGDVNDCVDAVAVNDDMYVGLVAGRIPLIGSVVDCMASPLGMIVCIIIPVGLIVYKLIKKENKNNEDKHD